LTAKLPKIGWDHILQGASKLLDFNGCSGGQQQRPPSGFLLSKGVRY
jgi:hypothetical protein